MNSRKLKNNPQRRLAAAVATVMILAVSLFSSCAKSEEAVSFKGQTISFMTDPSMTDLFDGILSEFAEDTGAEYTIVEVELSNIIDTVSAMSPAQVPDLMTVVHDSLGQLVDSGTVRPLDISAVAGRYIPGAIQAYTYNGKTYGLPLGTENVALIRNPMLVPRAPQTFEELVQVSRDLQESGLAKYGLVRQNGDPYHFYPILTAFGGYIFKFSDGGYDPSQMGIASPGGLEAARWLQTQVESGLMPAGLDYDSMHALFTSGQAAMIITGPWALPLLRDSGIPYLVSPIPAAVQKAKPFLGVVGLVPSASTEHAEAIDYLIRHYIGTEFFSHLFFHDTGRIPAYASVRKTIIDPDVRAFADAGENGAPMPNIPEMSQVWGALDQALADITDGVMPADEAFTQAQQEILDTIAR